MRALLDDDERALARRETTNISETLLSHDHLQCATRVSGCTVGVVIESGSRNPRRGRARLERGTKSRERSQHLAAVTSKVQTGLLWSTWVANGTMQEIPVGSVLLGRLQAERRRQSDAQTPDIRPFGGSVRRRRVHDTELGVAEEVGAAADAVQHARAECVGRVGVGVDVDLERGVCGGATPVALVSVPRESSTQWRRSRRVAHSFR